MWRRFGCGGAPKRKRILEFEEAEVVPQATTAADVSAGDWNTDSSIRRKACDLFVDASTSKDSPSDSSTRRKSSSSRSSLPTASFGSAYKSPDLFFPTPVSSRRKTLPAVVTRQEDADSLSTCSPWASPYSRKRLVSNSSSSRSPLAVKQEATTPTVSWSGSGLLSTSLTRTPSVKRGPSSGSIFSRSSWKEAVRPEEEEVVVIEVTQTVTPKKQTTADETAVIELDETVIHTQRQDQNYSIPCSEDYASSPSVTPLPPAPEPAESVSPPKKTKRRFQGLAGRLASHFAAVRADRLIARRDPHVETKEIEIRESGKCWGVSAAVASSDQLLLSRRSAAPRAPASGGSAHLALPLAQLQIHANGAPVVLHPVFRHQ